MRPNNFVLADYGPITISQNLVQVDFDDIDSFELYAGSAAADIVRGYDNEYLYYDSETPNFTDTKSPELNWENTGVDPAFEDLIAMVPLLKERKDDPYFGLDDVSQLDFAKSKMIREIYTLLRYTDAGMLSDSPISENDKNRLIGFRDGLRDLANVTRAATVNELDMVKSLVLPTCPEEFQWDQIL